MKARPTRRIVVGTTATQIRDLTASPVNRSIYFYPTGGGTVEAGESAAITFGSGGMTIKAGEHFTDRSQSMLKWMVASAGTVTVEITDYER